MVNAKKFLGVLTGLAVVAALMVPTASAIEVEACTEEDSGNNECTASLALEQSQEGGEGGASGDSGDGGDGAASGAGGAGGAGGAVLGPDVATVHARS